MKGMCILHCALVPHSLTCGRGEISQICLARSSAAPSWVLFSLIYRLEMVCLQKKKPGKKVPEVVAADDDDDDDDDDNEKSQSQHSVVATDHLATWALSSQQQPGAKTPSIQQELALL